MWYDGYTVVHLRIGSTDMMQMAVLILKLPWDARVDLFAIVVFTIAVLASNSVYAEDKIAVASAGAAPLCWSSDQLRFKDGEQSVRKRVAASVVDPPRSESNAFTPLDQRGVVRRVKLPPGKKLIALTFDLCETPDEVAGYQGAVVDTLRKQNIKATFFAGGKWMLTHEERAGQLMSDPLFSVENHTWEHRNLRLLSGGSLVDEINSATLAYADIRKRLIGRQCVAPDRVSMSERTRPQQSLFRFPFGACSPESLQAVAAQGLTAVQWDVSSGDPSRNETPQMMKRDVVNNVRPGSIVLFHANGRGYSTEAALPEIILELKKKNYEFVTVNELLNAGEPIYSASCYDNRPGDTDRYDGLSRKLERQYKEFRAGISKNAKKSVTVTNPLGSTSIPAAAPQ